MKSILISLIILYSQAFIYGSVTKTKFSPSTHNKDE
nr:MAG TPA: hypothetical protein [Caudoviricetes sp.]